jgi:hypothetical protein
MDRLLTVAKTTLAVIAGLALLLSVLIAPIGEAKADALPIGLPIGVTACPGTCSAMWDYLYLSCDITNNCSRTTPNCGCIVFYAKNAQNIIVSCRGNRCGF